MLLNAFYAIVERPAGLLTTPFHEEWLKIEAMNTAAHQTVIHHTYRNTLMHRHADHINKHVRSCLATRVHMVSECAEGNTFNVLNITVIALS